MSAERAPDVRAMVLAAGLGTRLRPLTGILPKPLAPVLGVSLIEATFALLARGGVGSVAVNTHHLAAVLDDALPALAHGHGLKLEVLHEPVILGTGGGVANARDFLAGADLVVVVNGDALLDLDLAAMLRGHLAAGAMATLLLRPNPDLAAFAPVETDAAGRVQRIASLPAGVSSAGLEPWLFAGVHVLDPRALELLPQGPSDINRTLHPALIARGDLVRGHPGSGLWSDVGTPRRLLEANLAALAAPPLHLRELAEADGYELSPGLARGRDVSVASDARVLGSVLGHGAHIGSGAEVQDSVLFPGVEVGAGARVVSCILGPMARLGAGASLERMMMVGGEIVPLDPRGRGAAA